MQRTRCRPPLVIVSFQVPDSVCGMRIRLSESEAMAEMSPPSVRFHVAAWPQRPRWTVSASGLRRLVRSRGVSSL